MVQTLSEDYLKNVLDKGNELIMIVNEIVKNRIEFTSSAINVKFTQFWRQKSCSSKQFLNSLISFINSCNKLQSRKNISVSSIR